MTEFVTRQEIAKIAEVVAPPRAEAAIVPPAVIRQTIDRSFELPTGLYIATVGFYFAFLGVMASAFMNPGLALPMTIFFLFMVAGFGTPMLWARMGPENRQRALTWAQFKNRGIDTATGRLDGGAAVVQVLLLPALIFVWGVIVATIAAFT